MRRRSGFTLIELLITTTIIGLLSSIGTVSYSYIREKARDAKRTSDIRTIRNALEIYFEQHGGYPDAPVKGIVLGEPDTMVISDAGITPLGEESGLVYLLGVPSNVQPGGLPYFYRVLTNNSQSCFTNCAKFEVVFELEGNIGEYLAGPHRMTDDGVKGPEGGYDDFTPPSFLSSYVPKRDEITAVVSDAAKVAESARSRVAELPGVQTGTKAIVAPIAAIAAFANIIALITIIAPVASFGQILLVLISQPFFFIGRRKREGWGTVYNAGTKTPVDLASVRLIDANSGRAVATKVTDKNGRYAFTPRIGTYRLEVTKKDYEFPSRSMVGMEDDGSFGKIYQGTLLHIETDGEPLTLNIPIEHVETTGDELKRFLSEQNKKQLRAVLASSGPFFGFIALVLVPSGIMLLLFLVHLLVYYSFKWLTAVKEPKNQGVIYDEATREPIARVAVRIFSLPYHKVLETKVTDAKGRYSFYVGNGKYYLTAMKPGYGKTETDEIDFTTIEKPTFIASDLPMRLEDNSSS